MDGFYRVEDLSRGLEPLPIRAMNEWNRVQIPDFDYIGELRLGPDVEGLFHDNPVGLTYSYQSSPF